MKSFNYISILFITVITCAWIATGCAGGPTEQRIVTVSIEPQRYLLEQITGDKVQVRSLLTEGANPETYDPSVTHMFNLGKSIGYLRMGNIGFEAAIIDKISEGNPNLRIFDTSAGIVPILGTHSHGDHHHHDVIDPHTWTSVKNAKIIAHNMLEAMEKIDPANKQYYRRNYETFSARLDSIDNAITTRLAPCRGHSFMVWHPSLSYIARDYGLQQVALGAEGKDFSAAGLKAAIDRARAAGSRVFFVQRGLDSRQAAGVCREAGAAIVEIDPMSYNWQSQLKTIADEIARH